MNLKALKESIRLLLESETKTLYVCRHVLNGDELVKWAQSQGFENILDPDEMHVTIAYSNEPVDWNKIPDAPEELEVRGDTQNRTVEKLGNATVLLFKDKELHKRWQQIIDCGASWDYDGYKSHISITYEECNLDLAGVEPYHGDIQLGPEKFDVLDED